jgi:hypothetical protein
LFRGALEPGLAGLAATLFLSVSVQIDAQPRDAASAGPSATSSQRQFLDRYCATCHNELLKRGGLNLVAADLSRPDAKPELWEKVVRKLRTGVSPQHAAAFPELIASRSDVAGNSLDAAGRSDPAAPKRAAPESNYASECDRIKFSITMRHASPPMSGHGFDNVNVGDLSATLLNR